MALLSSTKLKVELYSTLEPNWITEEIVNSIRRKSLIILSLVKVEYYEVEKVFAIILGSSIKVSFWSNNEYLKSKLHYHSFS